MQFWQLRFIIGLVVLAMACKGNPLERGHSIDSRNIENSATEDSSSDDHSSSTTVGRSSRGTDIYKTPHGSEFGDVITPEGGAYDDASEFDPGIATKGAEKDSSINTRDADVNSKESNADASHEGTAPDSSTKAIDEAPSCIAPAQQCNQDDSPINCCAANPIEGGVFLMGRCGEGDTDCSDSIRLDMNPYPGLYPSTDRRDDMPEHSVEIAGFRLDIFEVTVGRFRQFVNDYNGTPPRQGAGAHPLIENSGWQSVWNSQLPSSQADLINRLECLDFSAIDHEYSWTTTVENHEIHPINCVNWYEAFAFCIWDSGRLPTEAEWEYAAAGGDANRLYPWGSERPTGTVEWANYRYTANSPLVNVGSYPAGVSLFGQLDMAGSVAEWVLDYYDSSWYQDEGNVCVNCANLVASANGFRVVRGGDCYGDAFDLRAAYRYSWDPSLHMGSIGFRCARDLR